MILNGKYGVIIFLPICCIRMYINMHVFCMHFSYFNKSQGLEYLYHVNLKMCVMLEIHVFDKKVWFATIIVYGDCQMYFWIVNKCIKR